MYEITPNGKLPKLVSGKKKDENFFIGNRYKNFGADFILVFIMMSGPRPRSLEKVKRTGSGRREKQETLSGI